MLFLVGKPIVYLPVPDGSPRWFWPCMEVFPGLVWGQLESWLQPLKQEIMVSCECLWNHVNAFPWPCAMDILVFDTLSGSAGVSVCAHEETQHRSGKIARHPKPFHLQHSWRTESRDAGFNRNKMEQVSPMQQKSHRHVAESCRFPKLSTVELHWSFCGRCWQPLHQCWHYALLLFMRSLFFKVTFFWCIRAIRRFFFVVHFPFGGGNHYVWQSDSNFVGKASPKLPHWTLPGNVKHHCDTFIVDAWHVGPGCRGTLGDLES